MFKNDDPTQQKELPNDNNPLRYANTIKSAIVCSKTAVHKHQGMRKRTKMTLEFVQSNKTNQTI